jgi:hypothetical protein
MFYESITREELLELAASDLEEEARRFAVDSMTARL